MPKVTKSRRGSGMEVFPKGKRSEMGNDLDQEEWRETDPRKKDLIRARKAREAEAARLNEPGRKVVKGRRRGDDDQMILGGGWEDMLAEAMERDRQNEADKASASKIRDTAAADSKKRTGGTIRRKRCVGCHRKMPKSGGSMGSTSSAPPNWFKWLKQSEAANKTGGTTMSTSSRPPKWFKWLKESEAANPTGGAKPGMTQGGLPTKIAERMLAKSRAAK